MRFNESEYGVFALVKRIDPKDTGKFLYATDLDPLNITKIRVENDLNLPLPHLEIDYNDMGNYKLNKFLADGYTTLDLIINCTFKGKEARIEHTFYAYDMQVLSKNLQSTLYRLKCISYTSAILSSVPEYSSRDPKDGYTMAKGVLRSIKYPLKNDSDEEAYFKISGQPFFHITPTSQRAFSNLKEIFARTYSKDTGNLSLMFMIPENKGRLYSLKKITDDVKNDSDNAVKSENIIRVSTDIEAPPFNINNVSNLENNSLIDFKEKYRNLGDYRVKTFDYINRKWSETKFTADDRSDIAHTPPKNYVSLIRGVPKYVGDKCGMFEKVMVPLSEFEIGDNIWKMSNFTDVVQITTGGALTRDAGDAVILYNTSDYSVMDRWQKDYVCGRIVHMFEKGAYMNRMDLYSVSEKEKKTYNKLMDIKSTNPQTANGSVDKWTRV